MPGIYFEEIGLMNQAESKQKLVIKLDTTTALKTRFQQLQDYLKNTEKQYEQIIAGNAQQLCANNADFEKGNIQLITQLDQLSTLYNSNTNKRELMNAIGAKTAAKRFGTIDEVQQIKPQMKYNEQLQILQDQQILQHAYSSKTYSSKTY